MANSVDPDQLASESQLIWIYTVCKGRVYPGSAGHGLILVLVSKVDEWQTVQTQSKRREVFAQT